MSHFANQRIAVKNAPKKPKVRTNIGIESSWGEPRVQSSLLAPRVVDGLRLCRIVGANPRQVPHSVWSVLLAIICGIGIPGGMIALTWQELAAGDSNDPRNEQQTAKESDVTAANENQTVAQPGVKREFPDRFATAFVTQLRSKAPFLNLEFLAEVRRIVDEFLLHSTNFDPSAMVEKSVIDAMEKRVASLNSFRDYLSFSDALKDLEWRVWHAVTRPEMTEEEKSRFDEQCPRIRELIGTSPDLNDWDTIERFDALLADPLWPFFQSPLSESQFEWFQKFHTEHGTSGLDSVFRSLQATLAHFALLNEDDRLANPWPDQIRGGGGPIGDPAFNFASSESFLGSTVQLGSIDNPTPNVLRLAEPKSIDIAVLIRETNHGDIGYSSKDDALITFRGAKMLALDSSDWYDADQISDQNLMEMIERLGVEQLSMAEYPKHGFRAATPDPPLIAIQSSSGLHVVKINASDTGMFVHVRPRPNLDRWLDVTRLPSPFSQQWGPVWRGLRTRLSLAESTPQLGRLKVNVECFNSATTPLEFRFALEIAAAFRIDGPDGKQLHPLVGRLLNDVERDDKSQIVAKPIGPGESIMVLREYDLGMAFHFDQPGRYQIRCDGMNPDWQIPSDGGMAISNLLPVELPDGPRPKVHTFWQEFKYTHPKNLTSFNWRGPDFSSPNVFVYRRSDYEGRHFVIVTFTENDDPNPAPRWSHWSNSEAAPLRHVRLGKTPLGFAHLLICQNAEEEWPGCEQQLRDAVQSAFRERLAHDFDHVAGAGDFSIELVGVTNRGAAAKQGWAANGLPMNEALDLSDWPTDKIISDGENKVVLAENAVPNARDLLLRIRGLDTEPSYRAIQPSIRLLQPAAVSDLSVPPVGNPYQFRLSMLPRIHSDTQTVCLAIEATQWGAGRQFNSTGELTSDGWIGSGSRVSWDETHPYWEAYQSMKIVGASPASHSSSDLEIVVEWPENHLELFDYEFTTDWNGPVLKVSVKSETPIEGTKNTRAILVTHASLEHVFQNQRIFRFNYRLRPYLHFVTFENVSMQSGNETHVKVSGRIKRITAGPNSSQVTHSALEKFQAPLERKHVQDQQ